MKISFYEIIEMLGVLSFAVSGTSSAMKKRLDIFGILIIAFVTSLGGGTLRDILLGNTPVAWLKDYSTLNIILFGCITTVIFERYVQKLNYTLFIFDSLGLGLFTIIGVQTAMKIDLSIGMSIALGTITGCFGGVTRDILLNEIPLVFRKEIYASASILGGALYFALLKFGTNNELSQSLAILFIFLFRIFVVWRKVRLPVLYKDAPGDQK
jgi:uncharacterized membrane protein YeiH